MNPTVSVIIPAYNTQEYLSKAIHSALQQTMPSLEVIVVDDASTDNTLAIAQSISDPRLQVLRHERNLGAGAARNTALAAAKGEWIAILDSDDWFAPNRLEKLLQVTQVEETEFVADNLFITLYGDEQPHSTLLSEAHSFIQEPQFLDPLLFVETKRKLRLAFTKPIIRRDFLKQHDLWYDPSLRLGQDFWFYMLCFLKGARFYMVPEPYYYYRIRCDSLVNASRAERFDGFYRTAQAFLEMPEVQNNAKLSEALHLNLKSYRRGRDYYRVVEPLKQRNWKKAFGQMLRHPLFFSEFFKKLHQIVKRRWDYHVCGNLLAFEVRLQ